MAMQLVIIMKMKHLSKTKCREVEKQQTVTAEFQVTRDCRCVSTCSMGHPGLQLCTQPASVK